jgi:DNA-binding response OmpR family regulator
MSKPIKKVLIVDDDPDIRESVRLALQDLDFLEIEVTESSGVASGIKQLKKVKPDMVILDLHMGDKSGFDFMHIMHEIKDITYPKVIMLTADDNLENVFNAEDTGIEAHYFLGKPFNIEDLQSLVFDIGLSIKS